MSTVTFSIHGGLGGEAEFEVSHFQQASRFRWNEPPEPGEITLKSSGIWTSDDGELHDVISIEQLALVYTVAYKIGLPEAARRIEDEAYDQVCQQFADAYDERDPE